jgi:hypothetical protein
MAPLELKRTRILGNPRIVDGLLLAAYAALTFWTALRHEPWTDEANPWLIARDTDWPSFFNILFHNDDRHPSLWYFLLRLPARAGLPYFSQAVLHWAIATAASALFLLKSPFPRPIRWLWLFSYYMAYEYAVVIRHYGLSVLLLFAVAAFYPRRFEKPLAYALLIALLFHSVYLVFATAALLTFLYAAESYRIRPFPRRAGWALGIMIAAGALVLLQAFNMPGDHVNHGNILQASPEWHRIAEAVGKAFVPFPTHVSSSVTTALGAGILGSFLFTLSKKPKPLAILIVSLIFLLFVFVWIHPGDRRHYGLIAVILFFSLWLARAYPDGSRAPLDAARADARKAAWLFWAFCLGIGWMPTAEVFRLEWKFPFSGSKFMAQTLREIFLKNNLSTENFHVSAYGHVATASLLPYLPGWKFWYAYRGGEATYYQNRRNLTDEAKMSEEEYLGRTALQFGGLNRVFLLSRRELKKETYGIYRLVPVASNRERIIGYYHERYFLYKPVTSRTPAAAAQEG